MAEYTFGFSGKPAQFRTVQCASLDELVDYIQLARDWSVAKPCRDAVVYGPGLMRSACTTYLIDKLTEKPWKQIINAFA